MPMMKPRRRITKKQMKQDKLVTSTFQVVEYVQEHVTPIVFGLIALVALIILVVIISWSSKAKEKSAGELLGRAQIVYQMGDYTTAVQLFEPILRQYGGTKSAGQATYFLANSYFFTKDFDKALEYYEKFVAKSHKFPFLAASAIAGVAACYEQKEAFSDAARWYEKAAKEYQDFYLAPDYLLSSGRCYEAAGDSENARRVYQNIVDLYPESPSLQQAKLTLAEL